MAYWNSSTMCVTVASRKTCWIPGLALHAHKMASSSSQCFSTVEQVLSFTLIGPTWACPSLNQPVLLGPNHMPVAEPCGNVDGTLLMKWVGAKAGNGSIPSKLQGFRNLGSYDRKKGWLLGRQPTSSALHNGYCLQMCCPLYWRRTVSPLQPDGYLLGAVLWMVGC